jgi:acyl-CoA thioester hydrolase
VSAIATEADFRRTYPVSYEHRIEFREIDMLRHVNNVRYADWAESIRARYFHEVFGIEFTTGESVIIARHDMHYDAQVCYRDRVLIGGTIARWGTKSFDFLTGVWSLTDARLVFHSTAVLVAYDYRAHTSIPIPAAWRERAAAVENSFDDRP